MNETLKESEKTEKKFSKSFLSRNMILIKFSC